MSEFFGPAVKGIVPTPSGSSDWGPHPSKLDTGGSGISQMHNGICPVPGGEPTKGELNPMFYASLEGGMSPGSDAGDITGLIGKNTTKKIS